MLKLLKNREQKTKFAATLFLLIPAIVHLFPILYVLSLSMKDKIEVFQHPPSLIPQQLSFANYTAALETAPLARFLLNSMIVAGAMTLLQMSTSLLAAYALARMEFTGRKLILGLILATMMVPGEITMIPNYLTVASLGWIDTYFGLIAPFTASGFGIFLLYQFIKGIPKEIEEAARIDGASRLRFLLQFVIPLTKPALIAFGVYAFVSSWNQYLWPLIVTQSTHMQTAQIGIGMFRAQNESVSWGVIMAATVMLVSPTILLFAATQRQFIQGMISSGIKG